MLSGNRDHDRHTCVAIGPSGQMGAAARCAEDAPIDNIVLVFLTAGIIMVVYVYVSVRDGMR